MVVQDNQIKAAINEYFFKNRADFEAHKNEIKNNSKFYIEDDGLGVVTMQTKVLWENSSPTSSFAAQDVTTLDMSSYDYLLINFKAAYNSNILFTQLTKKGMDGRLFYGNGSAQYPEVRTFTIPSNTTISFQDAKMNNTTNNSEVIPTEIIGIKLIESPTQITNKYSTEETVVGEWIDGKKIYRKVYSFTNNSNTTIEQNISGLNYERVITSKAIVDTDPTTESYYHNSNSFLSAFIVPQSSVLRVTLGSSYPQRPNNIYVILEYTKTTD